MDDITIKYNPTVICRNGREIISGAAADRLMDEAEANSDRKGTPFITELEAIVPHTSQIGR